MEKKKIKLTISGSSKKTIDNIELAKSQGKNSVVIEKKPKYGNKPSFQKNFNQNKSFRPKQSIPLKKENQEALKKATNIIMLKKIKSDYLSGFEVDLYKLKVN